MFIIRRWRSSWRILGRCGFRGVGQQPTKGDWTTKRACAKTSCFSRESSLFSCKSSLFSCESSLFCEMKLLLSGPGAAVARPPRPISAAGRRHGGAPSAPRLLRPQAARENCWRKSYSVLCLFHRGRPMGERHEQQTSSRPSPFGNGPRRMLGSAPTLREPASRTPPPREARARTRASSCSNPLKTLKTAMGRPCNKLASMRGRRPVRLAPTPRFLGFRPR